ncbi:MAG: hypothetical protein ACTSR3_22505 [Candidatus Helarchaeota archaeon]
MKTNSDIAEVVKKLGFEWSKVNTDFGEVIAFEVPVKDRSQKCIAKISSHEQFGEIVEVVSVIGELNKTEEKKALETLLALLMLNQHLITAKTQIDQKGDKMYLVARTLAPSCSEQELGSMIQEVAIYADVLEEQLLGIDKS